MKPTREQLEFAAKASGKHIIFWGKKGEENCAIADIYPVQRWDPTESKTDSFDLMVVCEIEPQFYVNNTLCQKHGVHGRGYLVDHNNDKVLATMWASFLCAVEIGRAM